MKLEKKEVKKIEGKELKWREGNRRRGLNEEGEWMKKERGMSDGNEWEEKHLKDRNLHELIRTRE